MRALAACIHVVSGLPSMFGWHSIDAELFEGPEIDKDVISVFGEVMFLDLRSGSAHLAQSLEATDELLQSDLAIGSADERAIITQDRDALCSEPTLRWWPRRGRQMNMRVVFHVVKGGV